MTEALRKEGMSDPDICRAFGIGREDKNGVFHPSTTDLRALRTIANNQKRAADIAMAERLKAKGLSHNAIAERMGLPGESSVRALLAPGVKERNDVLVSVSNKLKEEVAEKGLVDVGSGSEKRVLIGEGGVSNKIGVSPEKLNTAIAMLREEGYVVHPVRIPQVGSPGNFTNMKVLAAPGTSWGDVQRNRDKIQQIGTFSEDGGRTFSKIHEPIAVNPNRVKVNYKEDGGDKADGVIYVREGVRDVSLGKNRYAQVRVQVGEGHYLKGMAMYKDDLPAGVDLVFNTNKSRHDPEIKSKLDAMKKIKDDPEFPFGSVTRPLLEDVGGPNERPYSAMNIVFEEGDWGGWSKSLSTQFLSKQSPTLAKTQLDKTYASRQREFDEIMSLTNPTVRKRLLQAFSESADSSAVHLEAAAINKERQGWHAILPVNTMKPTEVYAPRYDHGERVVLVRFPHGGTFELPELIVNNRHPEARKLLGDAPDAIGIHHSVAQHLSGADFDGDTVIVIPNNQGKIRTSKPLAQLKDFDPKSAYPKYPGMQVMTKERKAQEMGNISNLITDMTIKGASHEEIARAVKHSMVVIDAEKHELNWKQSAIDNGIPTLKKEYQGSAKAGASTLISKATSPLHVPDRRPRYESEGGPIDKTTGRKMYMPTGRKKINKQGKEVDVTKRTTKLAEADNAHDLVSKANTRIENVYADHSNRLKNLANKARLEMINTPTLNYSPSANKAYAKEVSSLEAKLTLAIMNRPLERQAQLVANAVARNKKQANPNIDSDTLKKVKYQALAEARTRLKLDQKGIEITPEEWHAIQAGAISNHKLDQILAKANMDTVKALATPRKERLMTTAKTARAKRLLDSGYTRAEVARQLGVSLTTLDNSVNGKE
jgi:hypothetical protein